MCFLLTWNSLLALEKTELKNLPFSAGETLYYKLSYRGLLTSMIWADIADASMSFFPNQMTPGAERGHQFVLSLTTERYKKAEMIQPVRYTYITTLDQTLKKTLLVEEIDNGENQSHDFLWLDWYNKETQLFKKREKESISSGFFHLDEEETWEKDGPEPLPHFLKDFPLLDNQLTYFIHKEEGDKIERSQVLDPLSLIYTLRVSALPGENVNEMAVALSDDIRLYKVETQGVEAISLGDKKYQAIKYKIQTDEKKDNFYYIWLNNDEKRIPLRMAMDAPLGKLTIDLVKVGQTVPAEQKNLTSRMVKWAKQGRAQLN